MTTVETMHSERTKQARFDWVGTIKLGLLGGVIAIYLCLVGLVVTFGEADLIGGVITFGHTLLILTILGAGYLAARSVASSDRGAARTPQALFGAAVAGLLGGGDSGAAGFDR